MYVFFAHYVQIVQWYKTGHWKKIENQNRKTNTTTPMCRVKQTPMKIATRKTSLKRLPQKKTFFAFCDGFAKPSAWDEKWKSGKMSPVVSRRVLRYWNSHICLWILQINISFEHFVWFFSRCPFLYPSPLLYHFWCILKIEKNDKLKLKIKKRRT